MGPMGQWCNIKNLGTIKTKQRKVFFNFFGWFFVFSFLYLPIWAPCSYAEVFSHMFSKKIRGALTALGRNPPC